jgi:hypothetical protein
VRKLKIISDGTTIGTRVIDLETKEPIEGIQMITWTCSNVGEPEVLVSISGVECEIITESQVFQDTFRVEDEPEEKTFEEFLNEAYLRKSRSSRSTKT